MASKTLAGNQLNFIRMGIVSVDEIRIALADILKCEIKPQDLPKSIISCTKLITGRQKLRPDQQRICCPSPPAVPDYNKFDVSLLYKLIRNLCPQLKPTQDWGKTPSITEVQIGDDIERLRVFRNEMFAHLESSGIDDSVFTSNWQNLEQIFKRIQTFLNTKGISVDYGKKLAAIAKSDFGFEDMEKYKHLLEGMLHLFKENDTNGGPSITIHGNDKILCGEKTCFEAVLERCQPSNNWPITWERIQGNITEQLDTSRQKYRGSSSICLVIADVSKEDEGEYRAVISRENNGIHMKIPSNSKRLTVFGVAETIPSERFMAYMKNGKTTVRHARGIVVGCAGAGKTTLLYRLLGKSLNEIKEIKSTRGLDVYEYIFSVRNGKLIATEDDAIRKRLIRISVAALEKNDQTTNNQSSERVEIEMGIFQTGVNAEKEFKANQDTAPSSTKNEPNNQRQEQDKMGDEFVNNVMKEILDSREKEISVSMFDFAGQFAYYACHQIYMRAEAFYILVMDMSKAFEDVVNRETDELKGSIFSTWSYKDYLYFWLDSIKSFSGTSSQVLAVATHTEGKTEKEKDSFLESLWTLATEDDKARLYDEDFALGLMEMNDDGIYVLQSLKESIAEIVSNKMDTKIEVPSAWALLEHLLREQEKPILSISDINRENKKLPEEYQLKNQEELFDFLSFFHGHGLLLFFKEEGLRTHAVLGIQWFSNAFSKLIADKDHINRDCKRKCIEDWTRFNATGNLRDSLLYSLWKGESSYIEHKKILMSYMERLRMLVSIEGEFSWYVPCMNQKPFTHDVFKQTHEKSSILCFRFTSFAMFVYYRLIAYCMSFLKWKVQLDKDKSQCLYHTAAIFETENHTVIVGIIDNDIQVQVLRINDIQLKVSCKIGKSIQTALTEMTATFNEKKTFQKGYKCLNLFCSEKDQTFIPEDELSGSQCNCPIGSGKHKIDVQWTLGFWEDRNSCCSTIPVASRPNLDGRTRFAKLGMATNDVLNQAYRDIVELEVLPSVCYTKVQSLPTKLQLYPEQERLLQDAQHAGYKKFDISLLYKIIRNVCSMIPKPTIGKWGQKHMPAPGETTVGDDIERIRLIRNSLTGHVSSASTSQTEFDDTWSLMAGICQRLEVFTKKKYMDNLMYIQNLILKEKDEDDIIEKLKKEYDRELLEKINSGVQELYTILKPESRDSADYDYYS